jgi:hypothetical protein
MSKRLFLILYFIFFCSLFLYVKHPSFVVGLTFFLNFVVISLQLFYNVFLEKKFSPFLSVSTVFQLLFFIVAPLIQIDNIVDKGINGGGSFIQNFPFSEEICTRANLYILVFNFFFFLSYYFFTKKETNTQNNNKTTNIPLILLLLLSISIIIVFANINTIIFQYQNEFYKEAEMTTVSNYLFVQKFLFFIPFSGIILSYYYIVKNKKSKNYKFILVFLFIFLFLLILLKNPLTEKRNALGPLYISLIFIFFTRYLNTNFKLTRFMFFVMVLIFPLVTILTHSRYSVSQMIAKPIYLYKNIEYLDVTNAFNSLHYDAYPNFLATIDYCDKKETVLGKQLMCSVFFFVPRSIWKDKPETTGFLIGNYLIDKYKFNWNNLSNPYISEAYINFGFLGIIIFAFALAYLFFIMIKWLNSGDHLKIIFAFYFAIYLMYFLRGDLTNGIAFIVAFWLAIIFIPKLISSILQWKK